MTIPRHVAIIMDGNGRWALEHGLPRIEGHRRGSETIEHIVEAAQQRGIKYLTLYAFSEENWQRPGEEVIALMHLLHQFLVTKRAKMISKGIRFTTIGNIERLPVELQDEIHDTSQATAGSRNMTLIVALSYGARQEICAAVNTLVERGIASITPDMLSGALDTADIPDPDLLIRTSNEFRISNFLLWQLAYTELYFTNVLWPDFTGEELDRALAAYERRERRFGMTSQQLEEHRAGGDR